MTIFLKSTAAKSSYELMICNVLPNQKWGFLLYSSALSVLGLRIRCYGDGKEGFPRLCFAGHMQSEKVLQTLLDAALRENLNQKIIFPKNITILDLNP